MPNEYDMYELPSLAYDREAAESFILIMPNSISGKAAIPLQFPPKIVRDSKSANWEETHTMGYEEFAIWKGARARTINLEIEYVVWGSTWSVTKIRDIIMKMKAHLYVSGVGMRDKIPFITIHGWNVIRAGPNGPVFRVMSVDIEYSREYVGKADLCWPLHTRVAMQCKLYTLAGAYGVLDQSILRQIQADCGDIPVIVRPEWA